jgi:urea transporter
MKGLLAGWERRCASSEVLRFVDVNLRGAGQVMFQNNPISGLLFIIAICWGSYAGGMPEVATGGLVALVASTFAAYWLRVDKADLHAGLFGFNAYLVGLALPTFLAPSPLLWVYVALGGAISVVVMLAIANVFKTWGVAALTAPFVLTALLMLLAARAYAGFETSVLPISGLIAAIDPAAANPLNFGEFVQATLKSISQVFLKGNGLSAILLVIGLALNSVAAAVLAVAGALVAVLTAHLLGAESELITGGLLGFSPVLTAIALGCVFYTPGPRVIVYALVGTVFTVIVQSAMNLALTPFGLPTLTGPFVVATWLFLLPRLKLEDRKL